MVTDQSALSSTAPLLAAQKLRFGYQDQPLLYDISLQVQSGEMVGLLGPNGSGKTTLLRLLSGVLQPQQGEVFLRGKDIRQWGRRGAAQHIAVVPQELHVPFAFTVERMVELGRTPFVKSFWGTYTQHDRTLIEYALQAANVTGLQDRIFNELSGGERQRVLIAMALAQEPQVLLLDEPTAHLDIKYQIETLELVQRLNREHGLTVIAALHDLNLAARYFPRLLLFQRGVVADASPAEVLEPGILSRVYDVHVQVGIMRGAEHISVLPPENPVPVAEVPDRAHPAVHVIAGGGSGALVMRALADAHIPFVAGALNIGDSDHVLALRLSEEVITEQPYSPISPATLQRVRTSLQQVKLLIICPTPFGPGNLPLLQEAALAAAKGLPICLFSPPLVHTIDAGPSLCDEELPARDYTGGEATSIYQQLLATGAYEATSIGALLDWVRVRS